MRILIDASSVTRNKAGVGVYAKNLIEALLVHRELQIFLLAQDDDPEFNYSHLPNVTMIWVPSRILRIQPLRILFEQTTLPFLLLKHRIDAIHSLHYSFPLIHFQAKTVVTIHDMTSFSMPEMHLTVKKWYFRFFIRAGRFADGLIFVSRSACNDFISRFGTPNNLFEVIYHGKRKVFAPCLDPGEIDPIRMKYQLPAGKFILYIGTIEPRKNLARLVEAFSRIAAAQPDISLVIAGMKGWMYDDLFATISRFNLEKRVLFPGFVAEEDKRFLLCASEVFAYVSLYEGFGLPVLEALACGIPTVTSNTSSLPEVAGKGALLIDPTSVDEIAEALKRLLSDSSLREELRQAALVQAAAFTWEKAAASTLAVYRAVLGESASLPSTRG